MELLEDEFETQWYRDLQMLWAGLASVGGIMVLYKGGVLWENWIKEQERKDMEEEIELTGTFIDPRAVRKDEDGDKGKKKGQSGKPKDSNDDGPTMGPSKGTDGGPGNGPGAGDGDSPVSPDSIDNLERLFGKS